MTEEEHIELEDDPDVQDQDDPQADSQAASQADVAGDEPCENCDTEFIQFVKEQFGEDLSHYGNDVEAIKGLVNARKAVGKRDDDARLAKEIRRRYGDEFLEKIMSGELPIPSPQQQAPAVPDNGPEDVEFDPAWLTQVVRDEHGQLAPAPGAPKDVVDKLLRFVRHRETVMNEFAKNPERFIESVIGGKLQAAIDGLVAKRIQEASTHASETMSVSQWASANRDLLFDGGDVNGELTDFGEKIVDLAESLMADGVKTPAKALQRAWDIMSERARANHNPPRGPSPRAMHVPNKKQKVDTLEDLIDRGLGLVEATKMLKSQK